MIANSAQARAELARDGKIRVAINVANPATVTVAADGTLSGPCIDLARALGEALDLPVEWLRFASAGQVVAAEQEGDAWDVAFLAVDPQRAARFHFSAPYLTIEAGYAVSAGSPIHTIEEVDRPGRLIATTAGAAYDLHLQRTLRCAARRPFRDPSASFAAFAAGGYDAVAGVRLSLEQRFAQQDETRILPGCFLTIQQAVVVPAARLAAAEIVDRFVGSRHAIPKSTGGA